MDVKEEEKYGCKKKKRTMDVKDKKKYGCKRKEEI